MSTEETSRLISSTPGYPGVNTGSHRRRMHIVVGEYQRCNASLCRATCFSLLIMALTGLMINHILSATYSDTFAIKARGYPEKGKWEIKYVKALQLVPTPLPALNNYKRLSHENMAMRMLLPSVGSDMTVTKNGTILGLCDSPPHFPISCERNDTEENSKAKWYPFPFFAPAMLHLDLETDEGVNAREEDSSYRRMYIAHAFQIYGEKGQECSTRPPNFNGVPGVEISGAYSDQFCEDMIETDPGGLDTEGLAGPLEDGTFVVGDEYGPSLVHIRASGEIISRFTPSTRKLENAYYDVQPVLPSILTEQRRNRGFESTFILEYGACGILQSPLGEYDKTLVVRVICIDLKTQKLSGVFLVPLDNTHRMINSASSLTSTKFLMLERHHGVGSVYEIDITSGTNLLNHPSMNTLDFEDPDFDFEGEGIDLLKKEVVFHYPNDVLEDLGVRFSEKIEGMAVINDTHLALSNDNDFGKYDEPSRIWIVEMDAPLV